MPIGFHRHGFGAGYGPGHAIIIVLFLALVVLAAIWVVSVFSRRHDHLHHWRDIPRPAAKPDSGVDREALRILEERFARGEIDTKDFRERRDLLREQS